MPQTRIRYSKIITFVAWVGILSLFSFGVLAQEQNKGGATTGVKLEKKSDVQEEKKDEKKKEDSIKFEITPQAVMFGDSVTMEWDISFFIRQGIACKAVGPGHWNGPLTLEKGKKRIVPSETQAYRINCGDASVERVVRVKPQGGEGRLVDLFISNNPDNIVFKGEEIILTWEYIYTGLAAKQACTLFSSADIFDATIKQKKGRSLSVSDKGSMHVIPQVGGQKYTLECLKASAEVAISYDSPQLISFKAYTLDSQGYQSDEVAEGSEIKPGTRLVLTWDVRGADECSFEIRKYSIVKEGNTSRDKYTPIDEKTIQSPAYSEDERYWHKRKLVIPSASIPVTPLDSRGYIINCGVQNGPIQHYSTTFYKKIITGLEVPTLSFSVASVIHYSVEGYSLPVPKAGYKNGIVPFEVKWSGENVSKCEALSSDGSWKGKRGHKGQELVFPSAKAEYSMECVSKTGKKVRQGPKTAARQEIASFVFSDIPGKKFIETKPGDFVNLKWSSIGAAGCSASSSPRTMWNGVRGYDGEESVAVDQKTVFDLNCGAEKESLTVAVAQPVRKEPKLIIKSMPLVGGTFGVLGYQASIGRFALTAQDGDITIESLDIEINGSNEPVRYLKNYNFYDLVNNVRLGAQVSSKGNHVVFTGPFIGGFALERGETRTFELRADTIDIAKNARGTDVVLTTSLNKEQGVQWSFRPTGDEKKRIVAGPDDIVLGPTIVYRSQLQPIKNEPGVLTASREPEVLATTPFVAEKQLPPLTFRLKAEKEAIRFSSFEITSDIPGLLASLTSMKLRNLLTNQTYNARSGASGPNALSIFGFEDIVIATGGSVALQLSFSTPPALAPSVEVALEKAKSDNIRLQSISAIGMDSGAKISVSQSLALLTLVPQEDIIEKPVDKPQKLSITTIPYSGNVQTVGKPQLFSGMNIHNFTDKPVAVGSVVVKLSYPAVNRIQLQYSTKSGEYDEKAEALTGSGYENYFLFKFPKPLLIEPDPKVPYKSGEAGLMKWWIVGVPKQVDKKIDFDTILDEVIAPNGQISIELESYVEPNLAFSVNNFSSALGDNPISYSILTVAPGQPLHLVWNAKGMDKQTGCTASIGLGGNDKDKQVWQGKKSFEGEAWVYPSVSTLYKLSCVSGDRGVTRDVFVQINDLSKSIPFIDFTYRKGKNEKKQEGAHLTWQVKNASACEASNGSHEKQTSWNGKKIFGQDRFTEFVARPAGETLNSFFFQCEPTDKNLKGYFSSSFNIFWDEGEPEKDFIEASRDSKIPDELPVGSVPGRQLLGAYSIELPKGIDMIDHMVLARDEKFGDQLLGDFFKRIELQYEDIGNGNRWIQGLTVSGDAALVFGRPPSVIKTVQGPLAVSVYGDLASADSFKKLQISEKGERMRLVVLDIDSSGKNKRVPLSEPLPLQTFIIKTPVPPAPPPPPIVSKGILFASRTGTNSVEIQDRTSRNVLANLSLEALGEDIEIRSITINQSLGSELSSLLSRLQLVVKKDDTIFASGDVRGDTIYFSPIVFTKKLILPKTGSKIELILIADAASSIPESLKEKIRSNPLVLNVKVNGVSGAGLTSNQLTGNVTAFDLVSLTVPPKTVDATACDATVESFKSTGKIRCGRIAWELTPQSAQMFTGDPRAYLMKYDELYGFYKDFMGGYEPSQKRVTLRENPTNDYPADANWWDSVIRMDTSFTKYHIVALGNFPTKTFSPSFMHEMGHIFGLGPRTRQAYIWRDMTEAHANMVGILPYMMAYDGQFKLISDFWCNKKLQKNFPCGDYFTNFEDYPEWLGANKDLQKYIERGETFRTLFIDPPKDQNLYERGGKFQTMITTLYSEFKKKGKGPQFYEAYKKTQQFYVKNPSVFASMLERDAGFDMPSDTILRANIYLLLLSSYVKTDILTEFETRWRTPIRPDIKETFIKIAKENFTDDSIMASLKSVLSPKQVFLQPSPTRTTQALSNGLKGEYYKNEDLAGSPALTRIDPQIDFVWGDTSPANGISNDLFSVRWTGYIVAPETGKFTFSTVGDDGVRLWVDNKQLVDDWNVHAPITKSGSIFLEKGRAYPIKLEYFEEWFGSGVRLAWALGDAYEEIIPSRALFPATPPTAQVRQSADIPSAIQRNISADALLRTLNLGTGIR